MATAQATLNTFNKRLEELNTALTIVKKFGFDEDLLEAYLAHNLKISGKQAREIITCIDEFHRKTVNKMIVKDLDAAGNQKI
jgi:NADH:ubiquinone oxidoreductase subunit E